MVLYCAWPRAQRVACWAIDRLCVPSDVSQVTYCYHRDRSE